MTAKHPSRHSSAVVTGAGSGIGRAFALELAARGGRVICSDINLNTAQETVQLIQAKGGQALAVKTDVALIAEVESLAAEAEAWLGGPVTLVVNNAGVGVGGKPVGEIPLADWQWALGINLWGVVHGVQAFTAAMLAQRTPALIINTGSKQGITNPPGNPAYNLSKAGVKALTESLQHELRNTPDARVSAHLLVPGYTYTGLTRQRVTSKPAGAWLPEQVVDYMLEAIARGSFYIICPDNEVTRADDAKRMVWAAYDMAEDRPPLSRWHADHQAAFKDFEP